MEKQPKMRRFNGVMSILLVFAALTIGVVVVFRRSMALGFVDLALAVLWPFPAAWFFCAKCPCRLDCGHVILGAITRILPERKPAPYTWGEAIGMIIPALAAFAFPQYWLWQNTAAFVFFWVLCAAGAVQARFGVCTGCGNTYCPLNKGSAKKRG
jgi:hypothetical protein